MQDVVVRAIVFHGGGEWSVDELPTPEPGPGEVRLKVIRTGVCGTDRHLLHGGFIAVFPLIPGHEMVGEVDSTGAGVAPDLRGLGVVVDNTIFCGGCSACRRGTPLYCSNFTSLGCNAAGGFAEYVIVSADKIYPIGDLAPEIAAFTEPTACALHGIDVLGLRPASKVLIFGAGPTGLILAQLLRANGAAEVVVAAPTRSKLDIALRQGAAHTVQLSRTDADQGWDELAAIAPEGYDAIIEATGSVGILERAVGLTRTGGTLMVYGLATEEATARIRPYEIFSRELKVIGSFAQANCIGRALYLLQTGVVDVSGLVTGEVSLEGFGAALDALDDSEQIKSVVIPSLVG